MAKRGLYFPRKSSAVVSPDTSQDEAEMSTSLDSKKHRSFFGLGGRRKSLDKIEDQRHKKNSDQSGEGNETAVPDLGGHGLFRKNGREKRQSSNGPKSPGKKSSQEMRLDHSGNRTSSWKPSFEEILSDHRMVSLFYSFLCLSHCEEHLTAYLLFEDFKATEDQKLSDLIAERIVKVHFAEDAVHPVNVEAKARFALCEKYKDCNKDVPKDFFEEAIYEVHKLLMQDCYGRFVVNEITKYWQVVDFPKTKQVKTLPSANQIRNDINQTDKWTPAKAMMDDIILVEKKDQCRGTINLKNCMVSRVMEMLIAPTKYIDWCPDIDESEETDVNFGPCLSVTKMKVFEESSVSLAVFRLSGNFFESIVGWESCAKSDFSISGGFTVDLLPTRKDTQVSLLLKVGKKGHAVKFVQNVLLGLLLAIGGQCESRESELEDLTPFGEFNFLKKL